MAPRIFALVRYASRVLVVLMATAALSAARSVILATPRLLANAAIFALNFTRSLGALGPGPLCTTCTTAYLL